MQDPESAARASLVRSLVIYTALLLPVVAFVVWVATSNPTGAAYVSMSFGTIVGLLLAYQALAHVRDLREPLAESEGVVQRVWSRNDLIITWPSYYLAIGRKVFRLQPEDYVVLEDRFRSLGKLDPPLDLYVKIVHFPHTSMAVSVHEIRRPSPEAPDLD